jgi:hypothetical protein
MGTPTLHDIAAELNERAKSYPIGALQDVRRAVRGYGVGNDLFRLNSATVQEQWACHWGGRTELQFNIGLEEGGSKVRHGVAFDFGPSQAYPPGTLVQLLASKVSLFNRFVKRYPRLYSDMFMWIWDGNKQETISDGSPRPISHKVLADNVFVFLGKLQSIRRVDYELILSDFDRLLPLYRFVESGGKERPVSPALETQFTFRPGCRTKKRSTIVRQSQERIQRDLRHNELQKVLYRRLVRRFGKGNVGTENQGVNGTSIDLVVRRPGGYWFYEIKTANTVRACIREALGQLLEYAFWPGAQKAVRLFIAGEWPIDSEGEQYLSCLKKQFLMPIRYEQIDTD